MIFVDFQSSTNIILGSENFSSQHDSLKIIIQSVFFFPQPPYRIKNQYRKWISLFWSSNFEGRGDQKPKTNPSLSGISDIALWLRPSAPRPLSFCEGKTCLPAEFLEKHYSTAIFLPTATIHNQKSLSKVGLIILKLQFWRSWWPRTEFVQAFQTFLTLHFDFRILPH